jgi:hypothetical protein
MPFVEQIVEYAKTSDKRGVTVDFLGKMANRNFAFKIIHRQTMTMEETTITMTIQKEMQMSWNKKADVKQKTIIVMQTKDVEQMIWTALTTEDLTRMTTMAKDFSRKFFFPIIATVFLTLQHASCNIHI